MTLAGVIDLGSNSIRLVVYDVSKNGKKHFHAVMDKKKIAGLSGYVNRGSLSAEGIACASSILSDLVHYAHNIGCDHVHIFATAVIRNCRNRKSVVKRLEKEVGLPIDVLSDYDEAHLGFVGAACGTQLLDGALIDIGGGSTEITTIAGGADKNQVSIPQGCMSSYSTYVDIILPTAEEASAIKRAFLKKVKKYPELSKLEASHLYGIGGSIRALHKLYAATFSNNVRLDCLEAYQIDALLNLLEADPSTFAHAAARAVPERIHTVVPGMIIARTLMDHFDAKTLTLCKHGVREGYLLERVL